METIRSHRHNLALLLVCLGWGAHGCARSDRADPGNTVFASDAPRAGGEGSDAQAPKGNPAEGNPNRHGPMTVPIDGLEAPPAGQGDGRDVSPFPVMAPQEANPNPAPTGMEPLDVCTGGDDVRLGYTNGGGFVADSYPFTDPYGHYFFFIDDDCDFYARKRGRLVTGQLSRDRARDIFVQLHVRAIEQAPQWEELTCDDGAEARLRVPERSLACSCGCDDSAPEPLRNAFERAFDVLGELIAEGEPHSGRLMALGRSQGELSQAQLEDYAPWPLDTPIDQVPGLLHEQLSWSEFESLGVAFDGDDAAALRGLWPGDGDGDNDIRVHQAGVGYQLWLRDQPPESVADGIATFLANSDP